MAKSKAQSKHSRAARRATSPSIDTDKSLKGLGLPRASAAAASAPSAAASSLARSPPPPPQQQQQQLRPSFLAVHRSAAVQKKKTSRPVRKASMSARARRRHEKGLDMAEAVGERTAAKVQRSVHRQRVVNARRKAWDDINKLAATAGPESSNPFDVLELGDAEAEDEAEGPQDESNVATNEAAEPAPDAVGDHAMPPPQQPDIILDIL